MHSHMRAENLDFRTWKEFRLNERKGYDPGPFLECSLLKPSLWLLAQRESLV